MKILGEGKPAFLEFLRNLTPQVLLLAVALTLAVQLDFSEFDLSNWWSTAAFFACAAVLCFAVLANTLQFIESYYGIALKDVDERMQRARPRVSDHNKRLAFLWRTSKRYSWRIVVHFLITLLVAEVGFLAASMMGIKQAIRLLQ